MQQNHNIGRKHRYPSVLLIVLSLALICTSLSGCGKKSVLVGHWAAAEITSGYPDDLILRADGTGIADGWNTSWSIQGSTLRLTFILGSYEYEYDVSETTLRLDGCVYIKQ